MCFLFAWLDGDPGGVIPYFASSSDEAAPGVFSRTISSRCALAAAPAASKLLRPEPLCPLAWLRGS